MASHEIDNILYGEGHEDNHASANRWRHQESSSFAKHAAVSGGHKKVREADSHHDVSDLADFLNQSRIEGPDPGSAGGSHKPIVIKHDGSEDGAYDGADTGYGAQNATGVSLGGPGDGTRSRGTDGREVRCGPLINYRRMEGAWWFGSVLIVTRGGTQRGDFVPYLELRRVAFSGLMNRTSSNAVNGLDGASHSRNESHSMADNWFNDFVQPHRDLSSRRPTTDTPHPQLQHNGDLRSNGNRNDIEVSHPEGGKVQGIKLYADPRNVFWRFDLRVQMQDTETKWEYEIPGLRFPSGMKKTDKQTFFVPATTQSMRIMFHSCNGFSVGTDEEAWSGPALWNDVVRVHKETPFHVMIGGGDQIYNDAIRVNGPLRPWSDIPNPKKRKDYKFPETLRKDCDDYYAANYIRWYSTEPFASANGQIPQLNLWDDHDIIDGFGSYVSEFMKCDVFRGIGGTAYKYYMLFQHHLPPPISTYTTDAPQTMEAGANGVGADPAQLKDTFVLQGGKEEPSYIIGDKPGPYVAERSRSMYARLGARIAFLGLDARTERTRHQINYPETYEKIFDRVRSELRAAAQSPTPIRHLIVLLGIPVAYPRLTWLENILSSPIIGPIKFLNKRFGVAGGLFNHFDGGVDLLDDLDDHYTARAHKKERLDLVLSLQELAAEFSVRITILGGDVHLAACGRFYSNPKLNIPAVADHRYIANIISSAIVNKPPPSAIANLLARRNKIHHLDENTDETLLDLFDKDPGPDQKTAKWNHTTMPSRNWAMITENPVSTNTNTANSNGSATASTGQLNGNDNLDGAAISYLRNGTSRGPSQPTTRPTTSTSNSSKKPRTPQPLSIAANECTNKDGHSPLHAGEVGAGSTNRAVHSHGQSSDGSLDVCIRVEKSQHDREGRTQGYGMWIPRLSYVKEGDGEGGERRMRKRDAVAGAVNART